MTSSPWPSGLFRAKGRCKAVFPFAFLNAFGVAWLCTLLWAHESPLDLLTRTLRFWVQGDQLFLRYEEKVSERSALLELHAMDRNQDGVIADDERDSYLADKARKLAAQIHLRVAETPLALTTRGPVTLRREWRQIHDFQVSLAALPSGVHTLVVRDHNVRMRPGQISWAIGNPAEPGQENASRSTFKLSSKPRSADQAGPVDPSVLEFILEIPEGAREERPTALPGKASTRDRADPKEAGAGK